MVQWPRYCMYILCAASSLRLYLILAAQLLYRLACSFNEVPRLPTGYPPWQLS